MRKLVNRGIPDGEEEKTDYESIEEEKPYQKSRGTIGGIPDGEEEKPDQESRGTIEEEKPDQESRGTIGSASRNIFKLIIEFKLEFNINKDPTRSEYQPIGSEKLASYLGLMNRLSANQEAKTIEVLEQVLTENDRLQERNGQLCVESGDLRVQNAKLRLHIYSLRQHEGQLHFQLGTGSDQIPGESSARRQPDVFPPDGRLWYWKDKRARHWRQFDEQSNAKLDKKLHKGNKGANVLICNTWHRVIFSLMKMNKINFSAMTAVKRSHELPNYESSEDEHSDQSMDEPIRENERDRRTSMTPPRRKGDRHVSVDAENKLRLEGERKERQKRKKKETTESDHLSEYERSDPDGSTNTDDVDDFTCAAANDDDDPYGKKQAKRRRGDRKPSKPERKSDVPPRPPVSDGSTNTDDVDDFTHAGANDGSTNTDDVDDFTDAGANDHDDPYGKKQAKRRRGDRKPSKPERESDVPLRPPVSDGSDIPGGPDSHPAQRPISPACDPSSTTFNPFDEISVDQAIKHNNLRLLSALRMSGTDLLQSMTVPLRPLASTRIVPYLLQSGLDIDQSSVYEADTDENVGMENKHVLREYRHKFEGLKFGTENLKVEQKREFGTKDGLDNALIVEMERIDVSTRTLYKPSLQFREAYNRGDHVKKLVFTLSGGVYETICQCQMYGLLWCLGNYSGPDLRTCLDDIILPDKEILRFRNYRTGLVDLKSWLEEKVQTPQQRERLPKWIDAILKRDMPYIKVELQKNIQVLCDGWTPMHYAILTRHHDLIKYLLQDGQWDATTKCHTLIPLFILDELRNQNLFEMEYVYSHIEGFTPFMLATFTENIEAIQTLGGQLLPLHELGDCLTFAYCENTETCLFAVACALAKKHIQQKYKINVTFHPVYEKSNPLRRGVVGISDEVYRRIEEEISSVMITIDNENIIRETLNPSTSYGTVEEIQLLRSVVDSHANRLWTKHSNLNAILPGHASSLPSSDLRGTVIVLHCDHKGLIPASELPFPQQLDSGGKRVLVHVIQGFFQLGPRHGPRPSHGPGPGPTPGPGHGNTQSRAPHVSNKCIVRVGSSVKFDKHATLGVFVDDSQGRIGILTCAHTFLNEFFTCGSAPSVNQFCESERPMEVHSYLNDYGLVVTEVIAKRTEEKMEIDSEHPVAIRLSEDAEMTCGAAARSSPNADIEMVDVEAKRKCGYVRRLIFDPGVDNAVDVALIMFDDADVNCDPLLQYRSYERELQEQAEEKLTKIGFSSDGLKFTDGLSFQRDTAAYTGKLAVKCGITSRLTVGALAYDGIGQLRISNDKYERMSLSKSPRSFIMKGQYIVENIHNFQMCFFDLGDSGSAVFIVNGDQLECLGIAIGCMASSPQTFVTPIDVVLEAISESAEGASPPVTYTLRKVPPLI